MFFVDKANKANKHADLGVTRIVPARMANGRIVPARAFC